LSVAEGDPELVRSQVQAFGRQIPLLYFILIVNTMAVTVTHLRSAPAWMTMYVPGVLCALCIVRCVRWWRGRNRVLTHDKAVPELRKLIWMAGIFGIAFTAWSLMLLPYGTPYEQAQVAFYMATTVVGCVFCLMHLRVAALLLLSIVILSFATFLVFTGSPVFIAMAVDMSLVGLALAFIIELYYRSFAGVVHTQRDLQASQEKTQRLSDENFRLASIDSLTDLPNRRSFFASLRARCPSRHSRRTGPSTWDSSIWTASSRSTTFTATQAATSCCRKWARGSLRSRSPAFSLRGSAATSSACSRKTANRKMRCWN